MTLLYAEITKAEQRIVEGIASTEALDNQPGKWEGHTYAGDVVDVGAIEEALPDYLKWANIREMHEASAVGTALSAEVVDGKLRLVVKVVDDDAWKKVTTKVYKGFSIGGRIVKAVLEKLPDGTYIRRILKLILTEISLVDRPANPDARILLFKREAPMADNPEQEQPTAAGLSAEQIAMLEKLAGNLATLQPGTVEKASADPAKIVALIQQARNEFEIDGDMDSAAMLTQAIALVQQVIGGAEPAAEETTTTTEEEAPPEETAMVAAGAKPGDLKKAGKAISGSRLAALEQMVKTALQLMAGAGHAKAQKALAAMSDGDDMAIGQAISAELQKVLGPLAQGLLSFNDRLLKIEAQPAAGGPVLRPVGKVIAGQRGETPAEKPQASALMREQMDTLLRKSHTDPNPVLREQYRKQYDALREQYA